MKLYIFVLSVISISRSEGDISYCDQIVRTVPFGLVKNLFNVDYDHLVIYGRHYHFYPYSWQLFDDCVQFYETSWSTVKCHLPSRCGDVVLEQVYVSWLHLSQFYVCRPIRKRDCQVQPCTSLDSYWREFEISSNLVYTDDYTKIRWSLSTRDCFKGAFVRNVVTGKVYSRNCLDHVNLTYVDYNYLNATDKGIKIFADVQRIESCVYDMDQLPIVLTASWYCELNMTYCVSLPWEKCRMSVNHYFGIVAPFRSGALKFSKDPYFVYGLDSNTTSNVLVLNDMPYLDKEKNVLRDRTTVCSLGMKELLRTDVIELHPTYFRVNYVTQMVAVLLDYFVYAFIYTVKTVIDKLWQTILLLVKQENNLLTTVEVKILRLVIQLNQVFPIFRILLVFCLVVTLRPGDIYITIIVSFVILLLLQLLNHLY